MIECAWQKNSPPAPQSSPFSLSWYRFIFCAPDFHGSLSRAEDTSIFTRIIQLARDGWNERFLLNSIFSFYSSKNKSPPAEESDDLCTWLPFVGPLLFLSWQSLDRCGILSVSMDKMTDKYQLALIEINFLPHVLTAALHLSLNRPLKALKNSAGGGKAKK